jgi:hypothetical protein
VGCTYSIFLQIDEIPHAPSLCTTRVSHQVGVVRPEQDVRGVLDRFRAMPDGALGLAGQPRDVVQLIPSTSAGSALVAGPGRSDRDRVVCSVRSCVAISRLDGGTAPVRVQVIADAATA